MTFLLQWWKLWLSTHDTENHCVAHWPAVEHWGMRGCSQSFCGRQLFSSCEEGDLTFSCTEPFRVLQWYLELIKCYLHNGEWAWIIKLLMFDLFPFSVNSKTSNDSSENKIKLLLYFTCLHNKRVVLANIFNGNLQYWSIRSAQCSFETDFSCFHVS